MTYANTLRSALVSLALVAGVAQAGVAQAAEAVTSRPQALTRAEVVADFNLWHRVGLDHPRVRGNVVAFLEQQDIAGHKAFGGKR